MPYVDLESSDDYASIFYTTNTQFGNVGGFDPAKSTIVMLHPTLLDSSWLDNQFGDPRLNGNYNLIAFDMRVCGKSSCRPSGRHDSWVEAADLAFCFQVRSYYHMLIKLLKSRQTLHLPPCHILAIETLSVFCALRLVLLYELIISLDRARAN